MEIGRISRICVLAALCVILLSIVKDGNCDMEVLSVSSTPYCSKGSCVSDTTNTLSIPLTPGFSRTFVDPNSPSDPVFDFTITNEVRNAVISSSYRAYIPLVSYTSKCYCSVNPVGISDGCSADNYNRYPETSSRFARFYKSFTTYQSYCPLSTAIGCVFGNVLPGDPIEVAITSHWRHNATFGFHPVNSSASFYDWDVHSLFNHKFGSWNVSALGAFDHSHMPSRVALITDINRARTYVLPVDLVNMKGEMDVSKIGWLQNVTTDAELLRVGTAVSSVVSYSVVDCYADRIEATVNSIDHMETAQSAEMKLDFTVRPYGMNLFKMNDLGAARVTRSYGNDPIVPTESRFGATSLDLPTMKKLDNPYNTDRLFPQGQKIVLYYNKDNGYYGAYWRKGSDATVVNYCMQTYPADVEFQSSVSSSCSGVMITDFGPNCVDQKQKCLKLCDGKSLWGSVFYTPDPLSPLICTKVTISNMGIFTDFDTMFAYRAIAHVAPKAVITIRGKTVVPSKPDDKVSGCISQYVGNNTVNTTCSYSSTKSICSATGDGIMSKEFIPSDNGVISLTSITNYDKLSTIRICCGWECSDSVVYLPAMEAARYAYNKTAGFIASIPDGIYNLFSGFGSIGGSVADALLSTLKFYFIYLSILLVFCIICGIIYLTVKYTPYLRARGYMKPKASTNLAVSDDEISKFMAVMRQDPDFKNMSERALKKAAYDSLMMAKKGN